MCLLCAMFLWCRAHALTTSPCPLFLQPCVVLMKALLTSRIAASTCLNMISSSGSFMNVFMKSDEGWLFAWLGVWFCVSPAYISLYLGMSWRGEASPFTFAAQQAHTAAGCVHSVTVTKESRWFPDGNVTCSLQCYLFSTWLRITPSLHCWTDEGQIPYCP